MPVLYLYLLHIRCMHAYATYCACRTCKVPEHVHNNHVHMFSLEISEQRYCIEYNTYQNFYVTGCLVVLMISMMILSLLCIM